MDWQIKTEKKNAPANVWGRAFPVTPNCGLFEPKDLLLNPDTKNKLAFILLDVRGARIMKGAQVGRIAKRNSV
jgi:hypothetical protein